MIRSFRHKGLKRFFEADDRSKLRQDLVERIADILATLDAGETIKAMDRVSYRLHPLKGELSGYWAVTVRANWRIIFQFAEGDAHSIDLVDYH
jgi:toxin HigB-1